MPPHVRHGSLGLHAMHPQFPLPAQCQHVSGRVAVSHTCRSCGRHMRHGTGLSTRRRLQADQSHSPFPPQWPHSLGCTTTVGRASAARISDFDSRIRHTRSGGMRLAGWKRSRSGRITSTVTPCVRSVSRISTPTITPPKRHPRSRLVVPRGVRK